MAQQVSGSCPDVARRQAAAARSAMTAVRMEAGHE